MQTVSEILTHTRKMFDPLRPNTELIDIENIAHALSIQNNQNTHLHATDAEEGVFACQYSLAEFCFLAADEARTVRRHCTIACPGQHASAKAMICRSSSR